MHTQSNYTKSLLNLFLALLIVSGITCKTTDKIFTFTIYNESNISLGANSPINVPLEIATPDVTTNSSQQFENNNSDAEHVKDIKIKTLFLTITNPSTKTFDFLKSIHIYISTNSSDEIELAYNNDVQSTAQTIELTTKKDKLDHYMKSKTFNLRTTYTTKKLLTETVDIKVNSAFLVTAVTR
jgi:hypothetical protein